jgi:phage terminase small subunit
MRLTSKQERFVACYKLCENGRQATIDAGYSPKYADQIAHQNLRNDRIMAELEAWRASKREEISMEDFVVLAIKDYKALEVTEPNKPRFLEMAGKTLGYLGAEKPSSTVNNLTQININGGESQPQLWDLTRKLLGND